MSKKKAQSPDRVAAAELPSSPVSTSTMSQPSTPVNNDDPSTWTKSKKKRMRQKRKREEAAKKLLAESSGESSTPVSSPKKQSGSTSKTDSDDNTKNKRQKVEATKQSPADANDTIESSPKKKKKKNKKKKKDVATDDATESTTQNPSTEKKSKTGDKNTTANSSSHSSKPQMKISLPKPSMMSTLQKAFLERLTSSRFRELNEDLYTKPSQDSFQQFTENPELFDQYHVGFRKQAKEWPVNPVDVIYKKIVSTWKKEVQGKKSKQRENVVVADFGCGDAKLAERLLSLKIGSDGQLVNQPSKKAKKGKQSEDDKKSSSCPFDVHSFDLVSGGNPLVTPADMSNVPLSNESIDVGVYCLALMGTNVADFVRESWRVLKFNGVLRVAEVRSRFETASAETSKSGDKQNKGKFGNHKKLKSRNNVHHQNNSRRSDDTEDDGTPQPLMLLDEFMALMQRCGFQCTNMDRSNKMFLFMDFVKVDGGSGLAEHENFSAKPCIYKRR